MILNAIYEQDFLDCSYGFRPNRSAHQALDALWQGLMKMSGGWVLEVDIKGFFDTLEKAHLRSFLERRVRDGVIRRTIGKWLNAGVQEDGHITRPDTGTPQGGVVSPLLANIYLHEVLDTWFRDVVQPRLTAPAFLIRYADDFVIVFSAERDARRVFDALPKRFGKYGLTLHPEKTRLIPFKRPPRTTRDRGNGQPPGSFDLLGFTHFWEKSRKGSWVVKRRTAKNRFSRAVKAVAAWCREHRHLPIGKQWRTLCLKLKGHCAYYGITGNAHRLSSFRYWVSRTWRKWLAARSQRARMTWERFNLLLERFPLPPAVAVHSVLRRAAKP
jgi:group II intron reverse transcriptase/maturase